MWSKLGMPEKIGLAVGLIVVAVIAFLAFTGWVGWFVLIAAVGWWGWSACHMTFVSWRKTVDDLIPDNYDEAKAMAAGLIGRAEALAREVRVDIKDLGGRAAVVLGEAENDAQAAWAKVQAAYTQQTTPPPIPPAAGVKPNG